MNKLFILFLILFFIAGCTKMEEKKSSDTGKNLSSNSGQQTDPHSGLNMEGLKDDKSGMDSAPEGSKDEQAEKLSKEAYDFSKTFEKNKNDENKKKYIDKHMAAGIYLMFEANLNPKDKYGPALKHFRKVLEVDPQNPEALQNKQQIEDIYNQMGRPIPQ